jgi:hypothetical protein
MRIFLSWPNKIPDNAATALIGAENCYLHDETKKGVGSALCPGIELLACLPCPKLAIRPQSFLRLREAVFESYAVPNG